MKNSFSFVDVDHGIEMFKLATKLWPINRSLTGDGIRETLRIIGGKIDNLVIHAVPSGERAFDWIVPDEWNVSEAWIEDPFGNRIIDFSLNNLHLVGYSEPVDRIIDLNELKGHLYTLPKLPDAIPYVTSYYTRRWGFCLSHNQFINLKSGYYRVVIRSEFKKGNLNYGEVLIKGESTKEIFLSTYICHPSMANNELSGPVVAVELIKFLKNKIHRRFSYRIIFIPETIGSLVYLSKHLDYMKKNVIAGFNISCVGDDRCYSYLPSRKGDTISDLVAKHVLKCIDSDYKTYTWLDRGSDERQYCAPGVDLPVATISRSLYAQYPEYHTSLDNLNLISAQGLMGGFNVLRLSIECIESNCIPCNLVIGEPQLGKRGLYPSLSTADTVDEVRVMMDFLTFCDGKNSLLDISEIIGQPFWVIWPVFKNLVDCGVIDYVMPTYF